jgi:hypothetical protein
VKALCAAAFISGLDLRKMRKLLLLTLIIAGTAGLCAFTSQAFAFDVYTSEAYRTQCPKIDTSKQHLENIRSSCRSTCERAHDKDTKTILSCRNSCDRAYDTCVAKYIEWDKKKTECRKPIGACWAACPKENQKCMDKCNDKFMHELAECAERAMQ